MATRARARSFVNVPKPIDWSGPPVSVNGASSPGLPDQHWNSSGRRIVRIGDTRIVLAPRSDESDRTWRSTDGATWTEIDSDGSYSGALITGANNYVYHFYHNRYTGVIYMVKFLYDATPGAPVSILSDASLILSSVQSQYRMLSAGVNRQGHLFVTFNYGITDDHVYLIRSTDEGATWTTWANRIQVSDNAGDNTYHMIDFDGTDRAYMCWQDFGSPNVRTAYSDDNGSTWSASISHSAGAGLAANPAIAVKSDRSIILSVQGESLPGSGTGVSVKLSSDGGVTWSGWILAEQTCGYGDAFMAIGNDGTIYMNLRSNRDSGIASGTCGAMSKQRIIASHDGGSTWVVKKTYTGGYERSGTRSPVRYQTWFNYGRSLDVLWCQYTGAGAAIETYYDTNSQILIKNSV